MFFDLGFSDISQFFPVELFVSLLYLDLHVCFWIQCQLTIAQQAHLIYSTRPPHVFGMTVVMFFVEKPVVTTNTPRPPT